MYWVEARGAVKRPSVHRTAPHPPHPRNTQPNVTALSNAAAAEDTSLSLLFSLIHLWCSLKVLGEVNPTLEQRI